jgi:hypothetical protein
MVALSPEAGPCRNGSFEQAGQIFQRHIQISQLFDPWIF